MDTYKSTKPWSEFLYIFAIEGEAPEETKQCVAPEISYADGALNFSSTTEGAVYHYTLTTSDLADNALSTNGSVNLAAAYEISAYATADGYTASETTTATLYWFNGQVNDPISAIEKTGGSSLLVTSQNGRINVSGLTDGESVTFYTVDGKTVGTATANHGKATLHTTERIVIAKVGDNSLKIAVK